MSVLYKHGTLNSELGRDFNYYYLTIFDGHSFANIYLSGIKQTLKPKVLHNMHVFLLYAQLHYLHLNNFFRTIKRDWNAFDHFPDKNVFHAPFSFGRIRSMFYYAI